MAKTNRIGSNEKKGPWKHKTGRWSAKEKEFIDKYITKLPVEQIALQLDRPLEAVIGYRDRHYGQIAQHDIKEELRLTPEWEQLKKELTKDELSIFEHRYGKIMEQFFHDILPTEETQIFQLIRYEILMHRNMEERRNCIELTTVLQRELIHLRKNLLSLPESEMDTRRQEIRGLEDQLRAIDISNSAKSSEYVKFQEKHESILRNLKGTRDQRIKNVEGRKKNFIDIIKSMEDKDFKKEQGKYLIYMQRAAEKELNRLSEFHQYTKEVVDKPILTHETAR